MENKQQFLNTRADLLNSLIASQLPEFPLLEKAKLRLVQLVALIRLGLPLSETKMV